LLGGFKIIGATAARVAETEVVKLAFGSS